MGGGFGGYDARLCLFSLPLIPLQLQRAHASCLHGGVRRGRLRNVVAVGVLGRLVCALAVQAVKAQLGLHIVNVAGDVVGPVHIVERQAAIGADHLVGGGGAGCMCALWWPSRAPARLEGEIEVQCGAPGAKGRQDGCRFHRPPWIRSRRREREPEEARRASPTCSTVSCRPPICLTCFMACAAFPCHTSYLRDEAAECEEGKSTRNEVLVASGTAQ